MDDYGLDSVRKDVREGRIDADRLFELLVSSQRQLRESKKRIEELERVLEQLQKQAGAGKVAEPYSMRAEEKRQQAKGALDKKRQRREKARRGRKPSTDKTSQAEQTERVIPEGFSIEECTLSHTRPVWRLKEGRAVLIAYEVYRGPNNQYGKIPGTLGRSEFGLEIIVAMAHLVYVVGLSFDKVCALLEFFQNLKLRKSQIDASLNQLSRQWEAEFETLCKLLAHSVVVHADETSWSINSVWAFLSEKARVMLFGVHKDGETLKQILDPATFEGVVVSDDAAVYGNFTKGQKCWAHLLRKAIKLTLTEPDNTDYREFTDQLVAIYRQACRAKCDGRMGDAGRRRKVADLEDAIFELCGGVWVEELPPLEGSVDDFRLLCNELMRLMLAEELFTFVTSPDVDTPTGDTMPVPGTNNESERTLRSPAMDRKTGRTSKTVRGARRRSVVNSVLESIRCYVPKFTLSSVVKEITSWQTLGQSCFARQLAILHSPPKAHDNAADSPSVLDTLLPIPAD